MVFATTIIGFNGRQVLERPVNEILKSGEPDFPFCLCWANENWTRRWDGMNNEVLLAQHYNADDDLAHIRALIPFFLDPRYTRVMDRPFFAIYRASQLPEPQRTTDIWRREAERAGLKGLFLVRVESHAEAADPRSMGFDCSLQFEPRGPSCGTCATSTGSGGIATDLERVNADSVTTMSSNMRT